MEGKSYDTGKKSAVCRSVVCLSSNVPDWRHWRKKKKDEKHPRWIVAQKRTWQVADGGTELSHYLTTFTPVVSQPHFSTSQKTEPWAWLMLLCVVCIMNSVSLKTSSNGNTWSICRIYATLCKRSGMSQFRDVKTKFVLFWQRSVTPLNNEDSHAAKILIHHSWCHESEKVFLYPYICISYCTALLHFFCVFKG